MFFQQGREEVQAQILQCIHMPMAGGYITASLVLLEQLQAILQETMHQQIYMQWAEVFITVDMQQLPE